MSGVPPENDDQIHELVGRLSRPHKSGGRVIERAAILAEGEDCGAILEWITAHDGEPEAAAPAKSSRGLHSSRLTDGGMAGSSAPRRYVLPPGALTRPPAEPSV